MCTPSSCPLFKLDVLIGWFIWGNWVSNKAWLYETIPPREIHSFPGDVISNETEVYLSTFIYGWVTENSHNCTRQDPWRVMGGVLFPRMNRPMRSRFLDHPRAVHDQLINLSSVAPCVCKRLVKMASFRTGYEYWKLKLRTVCWKL